ncbi:MAG: tetratricopeptide repeat protein [Elusimicrobiota bacterium]
MKRYLSPALACVLGLAALPLQAAQGEPMSASAPSSSAQAAQEILRGTKAELQAFNDRGVEYAQKGELDKARDEFRKGLPIDPGNPELLNNLGSVSYQQKRWDEAVGYYQKALKRAPKYGDAQYNLTRALYHAGRLDEARRSAVDAQALGRDMTALIAKIDAMRTHKGDGAR